MDLRAGTAKSILRSLHQGRLDSFLDMVGKESSGKKLRKICQFVHGTAELTETEIMRTFKLTRGQYMHWMERLAAALIKFISKDGRVARLGQLCDFLRALITAMDDEAAEELLRIAMQEAIAMEDFEFVVRFWQIAAEMDPAPVLGGLSEEDAAVLKENLNAFVRLSGIYQRLRKIPNLVERRQAMKELVQHPLLSSPLSAKSKRSTYYYLKLRSSMLVHLRDHAAALELQKELVSHLESYPWISEIEGLELVRALGNCANSHYLIGDIEQYHAIVKRMNLLSFSNPKAVTEKIRFLYPYRISISMESGSTDALLSSIAGFIEILETRESLFGKQFITQNLYTCLCGAIVLKNRQLWIKLNRKMATYRKADFLPQYYIMYRILEVVHAIEEGDWEDAQRFIANRTKRMEEEIIPKAGEVLRWLGYLVSLMEPLSVRGQISLPAQLKQLLGSLVRGSIFSDYFDLEAWVESKERGCSMMEIFHERASSFMVNN